MTKRRELVQFFIDNAQRWDSKHLGSGVTWTYIQRQPYTYVRIELDIDEGYEGHGFSKVMHPDQWDKAVGVMLAFSKACGDLADVILKALPSYNVKAIKQHLHKEN